MNNKESRPSAWAFENFRLYTYAGVLLPFAIQTQTLVIGWQVYEIKHDPLYLGLIGLTEALPGLSLALLAGYIVDKTNPLKVYKNVIRLAIFSALMLLIVNSNLFSITADEKVTVMYLAAFLSGVGRGFRGPSVTALIPQLVSREALSAGSAWTASGFSIAAALGPATGGFFYAWYGPTCPYTLNVLVLLLALTFVSQVKFTYQKNLAATTSRFAQLTAGARYVFSHQILIAALCLDMFAVLFGGAVALLPVFAGEILKVGPSGLGILRASASIGAVIGSLLLIRFPVRNNSGKVLLLAVLGFGLCMVGFGYSKIFWLSVTLLFVGGFCDSISMVIRGAVVQLVAPPEMRGRVGAVNSMFIGVSNQLGEFESGLLAKFMGTAPSVIFGGIITLLVVGITALRAPNLRKMTLDNLK